MAVYGKSFTITYVAWDTSANAGKTGDNANHTLKWIKDGTAATPTNAPAEVDATNAPGVYKLVLTAAEAQATFGTLAGKSSTANVVIAPVSVAFEQLPDAAPGGAGGLPTVDANNMIAGIQGTKQTLDDLNDVSAAEVNAEADAALSDYDAPTKAELDAGLAALNDVSAAEVNAEVDSALADYDGPTKAEMDAGFAALNDLSAAEVNTEVDTALAEYDAPTKAELDAGLAGLNDLSAAEVNAEVDTALADYDGPTKAELDAGLAALNDVSPAEVNAEVDTALADYDPPTKAELDAGLAGLNDLSAAEVNAEVDTALGDYDAPTKAELDAGLAALNDLSAAEVNAEVDTGIQDALSDIADAVLGEEINSAVVTDNTLRAAARAAWAQGFGKWELVAGEAPAGQLKLYDSTGALVRTFDIDDITAPTERVPA